MITLFDNCVSSLDRETHPRKKSGTAKSLKSEPITIDNLRSKLRDNYNIEITLTLRPKVRHEGVDTANAHLINVISKLIKKYSERNKFWYYFNVERHKPYNKEAYFHSHGIVSFYNIDMYADFLRKVAAMDKWFYRNGLKANWSRIISVDVKYPIKEGNVNRKLGSFKNWYNYIHDYEKEGTMISELGFSSNLYFFFGKKKKNNTVNSSFLEYVEQNKADSFFNSSEDNNI